MKRKIGNLKRNIFTICLSASMVFSTMGICYAATKSASYKYANDYVMNYSLTTNSSGAKATTEAELPNIDAIAFVSIFSYKNGTVKNSDSLQNETCAELQLYVSNVDSFKSYHALKDLNYDPMGTNKSLVIE